MEPFGDLFGPPSPTVRNYLAALWRHMWASRAKFIINRIWSAGLGAAAVPVSVWLRHTTREKLGGGVMVALIPSAVAVVLVLIVEACWAAYQIYRQQSIDLNTKRLLLDRNADDRADEIQRIRESSRRRQAVAQVQFVARETELQKTISELRERETEPDVTLEYLSPGAPQLKNYGAPAIQVQIDKVESTTYALTFTVQRDIDRSGLAAANLTINPIEDWFPVRPGQDLHWFAKNEIRSRANGEQYRLRHGHTDSRVTDDMVKRMKGPVSRMRITYADRSGVHSWEKIEILMYNGTTDTAYVEHGPRTRL